MANRRPPKRHNSRHRSSKINNSRRHHKNHSLPQKHKKGTHKNNKKNGFKVKRRRKKPFNRRKLFGIIPYYVTFSLILVILGIIVLRILPQFFINVLNWTEGAFWGGFIGVLLILGGILMLFAYWRNNVSMLTTKHSVNWN